MTTPTGFRDLTDLGGFLFGVGATAPILSNGVAAQRDTAATFLVDVTFDAYAGAGATSFSVQWSIGTSLAPGTWNAAKPQPVDYAFTATTQVLSGTAPGANLDWVWDAFWDLPLGTFSYVWLLVTGTDSALATGMTLIGPIQVTTVQQKTPDPLAAQLAKRAAAAKAPNDPLGNGLLTPFVRGPRDFVSGSGADLVKSRVRNILGARAAIGDLFGELPWRPDFGSKIWTLPHRNNDRNLRARASAFVRDALRWEPTIRVVAVDVEREPLANPSILKVHVAYEILGQATTTGSTVLPLFSETVSVLA
jgi:phage baseplate assembly protein W